MHNDRFLEDVEAIRRQDEFAQVTSTTYLLEKYHIASWLWLVVDHYIQAGVIKPELAQEPVQTIVNTETGTVSLMLSHDIKQPDLKRYIQFHYRDEIKPALDTLAKRRRSRKTIPNFPIRDQKLYSDYKEGMSLRKLAAKYGIEDMRTVSRIISSKKKKAF